jgi:mRNA interferase RelE/StbE
MTWILLYHHEVENDLESVGPSAARRIVKAIDAKLTRDPLHFGSPLCGPLADFRKLRVGDYRVVYQVREKAVVVYVLAVGPRRDKEIYRTAVLMIALKEPPMIGLMAPLESGHMGSRRRLKNSVFHLLSQV